jgi:hypothetical protein
MVREIGGKATRTRNVVMIGSKSNVSIAVSKDTRQLSAANDLLRKSLRQNSNQKMRLPL